MRPIWIHWNFAHYKHWFIIVINEKMLLSMTFSFALLWVCVVFKSINNYWIESDNYGIRNMNSLIKSVFYMFSKRVTEYAYFLVEHIRMRDIGKWIITKCEYGYGEYEWHPAPYTTQITLFWAYTLFRTYSIPYHWNYVFFYCFAFPGMVNYSSVWRIYLLGLHHARAILYSVYSVSLRRYQTKHRATLLWYCFPIVNELKHTQGTNLYVDFMCFPPISTYFANDFAFAGVVVVLLHIFYI